MLDFLATDGSTQSILVYMEGIRNARRFMSALRAAAYAKPVVVLKAGRKPAGSRVALDAFGRHRRRRRRLRRGAAPRRRGARAQFTQLFSAAQCLASRFRPVGQRLAIVTNGGGPAVLAADWADEHRPGGGRRPRPGRRRRRRGLRRAMQDGASQTAASTACC